jgi:oxygen-dependent protoporphyrinogen oxidase
MKHLLVIGGGLAGLSAAWEAKRAGAQVRVLESAAHPGGVVQSHREAGYLTEDGPNTLMASSPDFQKLLADLGLESEIVEAAPAAKERFVVRDGKLVSVPMSPGQFLTSPLLSPLAKLRVLGEPMAKKRPEETAGEESLAEFARRRFGAEAFTYGLEPFVAGIFAGDPDKLAVRYAFPRMQKMEAEGSLLGAGWRALRKQRQNGLRRLISFHDGIGTLPRALAAKLTEDLVCNARLLSLQHDSTDAWQAKWQTATGEQQQTFDAVVLAVPAHRLASLPLPAAIATQLAPLAQIEYPPVSAVFLGYPRHAVAHPLDGFGALVPRVEQFSILGVLFNSTLFPGRAPIGQVLLTVFVGGARQPEIALLPEAELAAKVTADIGRLLGITGKPGYQRITRWPKAIPQYNLEHGAMLAVIDTAEKTWPGLVLAGSYRGGVSVPQCLETGRAAARRALNLSPNAEG